MKPTLILLASALAGSAAAQSKGDYFPKCSLDCLNQGIKAATNCAQDDAVCMCVQKNYEAIYNSAVNCVLQACGPDDSIAKVLPAGAKFCAAATAQAKAGTASATGTTTGSGSGPATTGASGTATGTATGSPSTSAAPTGSGAASTTSTAKGAAATAGPIGAFGLLVAGVVAAL